MSGNRRLLLVCSQDEERSLVLPGWEIVPLVVARVVPVPAVVPGRDYDAVVVTSRHAVGWLGRSMRGFSGPVGVAGPATAAMVEAAGFRCVAPKSWGGEAALKILDLPKGSRVLFPCGGRTAGSVEGHAHRQGIELTRLEVYRLEPCLGQPPEVLGEIDGVAFLSGQMARCFHEVLPESLVSRLHGLPAVCTGTARSELVSAGWKGELLEVEKKGGHVDLSRLLLMAVLSQKRTDGKDVSPTGGSGSGSGGAEMAGPS